MEDVKVRERRGRQIFFSRDSRCLQGLITLMEDAGHRALVLWALDCAKETLAAFEAEWPGEARPRLALERSAAWARGEIKMPEARRAILDAHTAAKEAGDRHLALLAHAIGQAGSTVHAKGHAPGLVFYELTAIRLKAGADWEGAVARRIDFYVERLLDWRGRADEPGRAWAKFLQK